MSTALSSLWPVDRPGVAGLAWALLLIAMGVSAVLVFAGVVPFDLCALVIKISGRARRERRVASISAGKCPKCGGTLRRVEVRHFFRNEKGRTETPGLPPPMHRGMGDTTGYCTVRTGTTKAPYVRSVFACTMCRRRWRLEQRADEPTDQEEGRLRQVL